MVDICILYSMRSGSYADSSAMDIVGFDTHFRLAVQLGRNHGRYQGPAAGSHTHTRYRRKQSAKSMILPSKCDLLRPRLRIEAENGGTKCRKVWKSVKKCGILA